MVKAKIDTDIDFIEKVADLGEDKRVVIMCRHMLKQLGGSPDYKHQIFRLRSLLTRTLPTDTEFECELLEKEFDFVFEYLLAKGDKLSAAKLLITKSDRFYGDRFWGALTKLSNLFSDTKDYEIAKIVLDGYERMLRECPQHDPDYFRIFKKLILLLQKDFFDVSYAIEWLDQQDDSISEAEERKLFFPILLEYFNARHADIGLRLNWLLAKHFNLVDQHESAIKYWLELLLSEAFPKDRDNLALWIAESYVELEKFENAKMFLNEVLRVSDPASDQTQSANDLLLAVQESID